VDSGAIFNSEKAVLNGLLGGFFGFFTSRGMPTRSRGPGEESTPDAVVISDG
jgi:hypothetical protein